ncbi:hypothetical protein KNT91_gp059 [Aeromonas phage 60AhydR15PP]|uniref:Uncharacterized protein n=1 Tax=Aeromonas phage 60AhydR15PP TaxID=2163979 RepID=A0A2S1PG85_9CAUD|nr:hypothetical protein KNT91_gp059 [Aeromonas phage 60AhydR15PP]AWH15583.1 hypothetical protein [Aeromonas phage 60AhydR15PP]
MHYIINKNGIAFVVSLEGFDISKIDGKTFSSLYDMNLEMHEECIGFEYLVTREAPDSPVMMYTQYSGEIVKIEPERFINEFVL